MQGLHGRIILSAAVALIATSASAQYIEEPDSHRYVRSIASFDLGNREIQRAAKLAMVKPSVHHVAEARFVKLHFSRLDLPEGVYVEISNPENTETWRYSSTDRDPFTTDESRGDDGISSFWAMSITGDTAIVRLAGQLSRFDPALHGYEIDTHYADLPSISAVALETKLKQPGHAIETTCGSDERLDAICWADQYEDEFERASPVALLITSTGKKCTAWRVSSSNRMFTARHCISKQSQLDGAEIWFNYQSAVCGSEEAADTVKVTGDTLLEIDYSLDFALFSVNDFSQISQFGNFGLDLRDGNLGEKIFIPQHGLGQPKQIAIESDMNSSGRCEIDDLSVDGYAMGTDIGYMCDTVTSSSGSPVVSGETGRVIALHHLGGCVNSGAKFTQIWPLVESHFNGVPEGNASGRWSDANELPRARITASCEGLGCELDGSGSSDSDGSIAAYEWVVGENAYSGSTITVEFEEAGDYEVTLAVTDDEGAIDMADKTVTVSAPNHDPDAKFSTSCVQNVCSFDGSSSSDPDGDLAERNWDFGDGSSASGESVEHSYDEEGSYPVVLTVVDEHEASDQSDYTVSITMPNEQPTAAFSVSCDELSCSLDAGDSSDPDGNIVDWSWDFGDGTGAAGETAQHTYSEEGSYTVVLTVTDDQQATGQFDQAVTVEKAAQNQKPDALFLRSCTELSCSFDGSISNDADGDVVDWSWDFGDGQQGSGSTVDHVYAEAGTYTVSLVVTDDDGASDSRKRTVTVEPGTAAPVARFTVSCQELVCALDAGPSTASESPAPTYDWAFGDGSTGTGGAVTHQYTEDGTYTVTLKVTDGNGTSTTHQEVVVSVEEVPEELLLSATNMTSKNRAVVNLSWSGAQGGLELFRDGQLIAAVSAAGSYTDHSLKGQGPMVSYSVCETDTGRCSNTVKLDVGKI